jgi:O-antigen/teichoic acid export membrane protein
MLQKIKSFLFTNVTNRQTFAKNAFWLAFGNIGGRLVRGAIIIYAARVLGAAGWGIFSYGITLVAFLTVFIDIGIDAILTREAAKVKGDLERRVRIISTALYIKLTLLALGVATVLFIAPHLAPLPGLVRLLPLMAAILVFDTLRNFSFAVMRSKERMEYEAMLYIFTNLSIVASGILFLHLWPTPASFTLSYATGTLLGLIATTTLLWREFIGAFSNFSKSLVWEILRAAWPFAISAVLSLLMLNTDVLVIGWFRSAEDVGLYSAAVRIIQLLYIFGGVAALSSLPIFSRFYEEDRARIRPALERILKFGFAFSLPAALGGIVAGPRLIYLFFGGAYSGATLSFQILLLTLAFNFLASILANVVFVHDKQRSLTVYMAIGGILNLTLDFLFIPRFGIVGSAFATLIAQLVADSYLWFIAWRIVRFSPHLKLGKVIFSSATAALTLYLLLKIGVTIFVAGPIAAIIYFGLLYVLKEPVFKEALAIFRFNT